MAQHVHEASEPAWPRQGGNARARHVEQQSAVTLAESQRRLPQRTRAQTEPGTHFRVSGVRKRSLQGRQQGLEQRVTAARSEMSRQPGQCLIHQGQRPSPGVGLDWITDRRHVRLVNFLQSIQVQRHMGCPAASLQGPVTRPTRGKVVAEAREHP
jgi:hypothetical protein